jgi:hypothetical protein
MLEFLKLVCHTMPQVSIYKIYSGFRLLPSDFLILLFFSGISRAQHLPGIVSRNSHIARHWEFLDENGMSPKGMEPGVFEKVLWRF